MYNCIRMTSPLTFILLLVSLAALVFFSWKSLKESVGSAENHTEHKALATQFHSLE